MDSAYRPYSPNEEKSSMIHELTVAGYRSIRNLRLQLRQVNVLVGPNGCGKSNLYRSMYLLSQAAQGRLARALAEEGGMPSVLWAGARKKGAVRMTLGVRLDDFEYEWQCGLPVPPNPFPLDPVVKEEHVRVAGPGARKVAIVQIDQVVRRLTRLEIAGRVVGVRFHEQRAVQRQRRHVTLRAADLLEQPLAVPHGLLDLPIARDDAAGHLAAHELGQR